MKWTKEAPKPPESGPSDFYWYWPTNDKEASCVEVWPGRYLKHLEGWWWPEVVTRPTERIETELKKEPKLVEIKQKRKVGRPRRKTK